MPKIGTVNFTGQSGNVYKFDVFNANTNFNDVSAVYALSNRSSDGTTYSHEVAYFGESQELGTRIANHEKWPCANSHGVNSVCVHQVSTKDKRLAIETDLIQKYNPPCNDQ